MYQYSETLEFDLAVVLFVVALFAVEFVAEFGVEFAVLLAGASSQVPSAHVPRQSSLDSQVVPSSPVPAPVQTPSPPHSPRQSVPSSHVSPSNPV